MSREQVGSRPFAKYRATRRFELSTVVDAPSPLVIEKGQILLVDGIHARNDGKIISAPGFALAVARRWLVPVDDEPLVRRPRR